MMMFSEQKGLESDVLGDGTLLEHVSEFKYLECVLGEWNES